MSNPLRTALLDLGDVPAPPDLATGALARARRDRRRGVVGIVAVLAAVALAVPVIVLGRPGPAEPAVPAARFLVTGYSSRDPDALTRDLGDYEIYRRSAGGYAGTPWWVTIPSPDGRTVVVVERNGNVGIVPAARVGEPAAVRWIPGSTWGPGSVWSPDSRRLYVPAYLRFDVPAGAVTVFGGVVDARTAARRDTRLSWSQVGRPTGQVLFGPGGAGFAVAPEVRSSRFPERVATDVLRLFDDRGTPLRTVPVGRVAVPDQPFSADGRLLATYADGRTRVLDLATGAEEGRADGEAVGWYDDGRVVVRAGRSVRVVDFRSGRVLAERQLVPAGRELTGVWLAPLVGPAPPGAFVL
jgi:hypothetical protein